METHEPKTVSIRTMDIVVAILLLIVAGVVMMDSMRLGISWRETDGPGAGYFPFYIALSLGISSAVNLLRAVLSQRGDAARAFVTGPAFRRVLAVLLPLVGYVVVLNFVGLYLASALYLALFMWSFGEYPPVYGVIVGLAVALALFVMFEFWFLVPLPKGPIEHLLGY